MVLRMLWESQSFPHAVTLILLESSEIRIRGGEAFDYIFPQAYFYSHNTAH